MNFKSTHVAILIAALAAAACGNGGGGKEDAGSDGNDGSGGPPVCGIQEFIAIGTLNGSPVEERATVSGQFLVNIPGDTNCYVNVYFEGGGRLRLEWPETLASGEDSQASGSVNLEAQGGLNAGNCSTDGFVSEMTMLEEGVEFVLRSLRKAPYCSGPAYTGELAGCATFK
jgi:hypothetical protein